MTPLQIAAEILESKKVQDASGNVYILESNVDKREGDFLRSLLLEHQPANTIEIGCAFGLSSLFICSALEESAKPYHHTIIDPFQSTQWKNVGVTNLKKGGVNSFTLLEEISEMALPRLLAEGKKFDFAFIDGWHTFDHTLIDFFYLNRMLQVGGIIVIDDVGMKSISKLMRYLMQYPAYKVAGAITFNRSAKRELVEAVVKGPFRLLAKAFPAKLKYEIFSGTIIEPDKKLMLNSSMIALQKVSEDTRPWNWYKDF